MYNEQYSKAIAGNLEWNKLSSDKGENYNWDTESTYIQKAPFFDNFSKDVDSPEPIKNARLLCLLGDSVTTDHISPAGSIQKDSPTGDYFMKHQILPKDYNSYGSRRGNHEVMMRGTFANIRIKNEMDPGTEGGFTKLYPDE